MTLHDYLAANLNKPFAWGAFDCVLYAAAWVEHKTGIDHLAGIQKWETARQGMRIVKEMGGMEQIIDARLKRVHPNLARDGDIALYKGRVAIFSGSHIVGPGTDGLVHINRMEAECAWSC